MRICHIGWANSPHVYRVLKWFAVKGYDVHIITNQPFYIEGIKIYNLGVINKHKTRWQRYKNFEFNISWWWVKELVEIKRIKRIIQDLSPDIVHSHSLWYPGYYGVYLNFHPYVVSVFNGDVLWTKPNISIFEKFRTNRALRNADLILGESKNLIDAAISRGANRNKTQIMKIGVDLKVFFYVRDKMLIREEINLPKSMNIVLSPRSIDEFYNIITLIKAIPKIITKIQNVLFVFICHHINEVYFKKLQKKVADLNIEKYVLFVGKVAHYQVAKYHQASDIFISISPKDSGPMALQEAMACGAAPIISDLPSVRELVQDGFNGILVDPYNIDQVADSLIRLLIDKGLRKKFTQRNQKIAEEYCNHEREMQKLEKSYYQLMEQ